MNSIARITFAIGIGALGVIMTHYPMILSGFRRIQTDLGDTRLIHYLLEHGYRWATRQPGHLEFWSPPFFFPEKDVAAFSDVLVSVGPVYWLCRQVGASLDLSFGSWMIAMSVLNYSAGLLFFRRGLGFSIPAATAGAALIAFGAPRLNQMGHPQLLPSFYPLLALYALARLFGDLALSQWARAVYWLLAVAAAVAQLYAAVYLGWFLIAGLGVTAAIALVMPTCRPRLLRVVQRDFWIIAVSGAGGLLLLRPFLAHYLPAEHEVSSHSPSILRALHPRISSWFDMGPNNLLWGWTTPSRPVGEPEFAASELHLGIGFFTSMACLAGLYTVRNVPAYRLAAAVAVFVWFVTTFMPGGAFARIGLFLTMYCAAGLFHDADEPVWRGLGLLIVLCVVVLTRFTKSYLIMLGLMMVVLCVLEIIRARESRKAWIAPGIALLFLGMRFFDFDVFVVGMLLVTPVTGLVAYYARRCRWNAVVSGLVLLMILLMGVTFWPQPHVVRTALVATPAFLAATARRRWRPPAWRLAPLLFIAILTTWLFNERDSLWLAYSDIIPGALAIRAVGRVVLILLVPAGLALAALVEFLHRRRFAAASWLVVLLSLAEQATTTTTFDAAENRATIGKLEGKIDRTRIAFFYHPADGLPFYRHHLDAMWASVETGVPTINGYSGHAPRAWHDFFRAEFDSRFDIRKVLLKWNQSHGLQAHQVQWIGAD